MGLAFYGRGFTLANSKCTTRGCPVKAVGTLGKCGDDPGILYNAEIRERIRERNLTITLDKNAAVELVNWDDEWISFDSERSFNIRANFARARGINAFMVWAMSHDDHKGTDSKALGKGLGLCV
jgi:GH18 family chitinase